MKITQRETLGLSVHLNIVWVRLAVTPHDCTGPVNLLAAE
jgi:hypothetical protein